MDFDLSEEQRLLAESVGRLMADAYGFDKRKAYAAEPQGFSRAMWTRYAELGLLGLPFPEEHGGIGGGGVEVMIVMEALGQALALEPYLETVVLAGELVAQAGDKPQQARILPEIAAGRRFLALAHGERLSRHSLHRIATRYRRTGSAYVIDGRKSVVLGGESADELIVTALGENGLTLFLVPRGAPGVSVQGYATVDARHAAEVSLDGVSVDETARLGRDGGGAAVLEPAIDRAIAALAAEAVGVIAAINRMTLDYLKTRKQFGVPIGSFQVLQHRMVDMTIEAEQAKSLTILAALALDDPDPQTRGRAVSAAKYACGRAGRLIGEQAVQLHGGMGMTNELMIGHCLKRLTAIDQTFGDAEHHLTRFAELSLG